MDIVTEMSQLIKSSETFSEMEEKLMPLYSQFFSATVAQCLETLDKEIVKEYTRDGWEIDRLEERQLVFVFGTVIFKRRRIRRDGERSFMPLDRVLSIPSRQHFTSYFQEVTSQLSSKMTYRQASESISLLTQTQVSHQTVHAMTQRVGEKLLHMSEESPASLRTPEVLFVEGDGVFIGSKEKGKHHEMKRGCLHEGVEKRGHRTILKNPVYFAVFGKSEDLFKVMSSYIQSHYDLSHSVLIANSDGGSGYEKSKFEDLCPGVKCFEYCLDAYHVMKQITMKLGFASEYQKELGKAVKAYDKGRVEVLLDTLESQLEQEKEIEKLGELRNYLMRNWDSIKPLSMRECGVTKGVGICESGHRFFTNRLKRQGRNWTLEGVSRMAAILTSLRNGSFHRLCRMEESETLVLLEESPIYVGSILRRSGHEAHTIPQASIPNAGSTSSPIGKLAKSL